MPDNTTFSFEYPEMILEDDLNTIDRIISYLTYAGIDAGKLYNKEQDNYQLYVPREQKDQVSKLLDIFFAEESKQTPEEILQENTSPLRRTKVFQKSIDKYHDNSSTAVMLIVVGAGVFIAAFKNILELSDKSSSRDPVSSWLYVLVFLIIGIILEVIGCKSMQQAKRYKRMVADEEKLTSELTEWFITTYDRSQIDSLIYAEEEPASAEILCLKRMEKIHDFILREYADIDESFVDKLCDDLYSIIFESQQK